jgi:hypothetical protein
MATYEILYDGGLAIRCLVCGRTSWSLGDIRHRYCGHCHVFHEDEPQPTDPKEVP